MFEVYYDQYNPKYEIIPLGHQGENEARCLIWDISEYIDEFQDGTVQVKVTQPDSDNEVIYWASNVTKVDGQAKWTLTDVDTAGAGIGLCELYYYGPEGEVLAKCPLTRFEITPTQDIPGDAPDPYEDLLSQVSALASQAQSAAASATASATSAETSASQAASVAEDMVDDEASIRAAQVEALQSEVAALRGAVGSPLVAPLASVMSDTTKVYVYTGSESGYTYGNWYYFNGSSWVSGGVYNSAAVNVDKSLTVDGMAADAAVTGSILNALITETATPGSVVSFDDGADGVPVKSLTVNITAQQSGSGDPSPSNIREITGFNAAYITVASENLLFGCETQTVNGVTATVNADGSVSLSGTCTASDFIILRNGIHLKAGTYTLKCVKTTDPVGDFGSGTRFQMYSYAKAVGLNIRWSFDTDVTATATLPEANDYYARIRIAANVSYDNITLYPMLVLGDTAPSEFITAKGATYNISFGSAGMVYGGTLDVTSGMLTATAIGYVFDGTENWIRVGNENARIFRFVSPFQTVATSPVRACSHFPNAAITTSTTNIGYLAYSSTGSVNTNMNFRPTNTEDMTLAQWKEWVAGQYANGTPLTAWYEPINPASYQLDPTTVKTILEQNNIWADCGDITELTYRADTKLYINNLLNS